jgi:hypothetical protein
VVRGLNVSLIPTAHRSRRVLHVSKATFELRRQQRNDHAEARGWSLLVHEPGRAGRNDNMRWRVARAAAIRGRTRQGEHGTAPWEAELPAREQAVSGT